MEWSKILEIGRRNFTCGYCDKVVASNKGYSANVGGHFIYICPGCDKPLYFHITSQTTSQTPAPLLGHDVDALPDDVASIYTEARQCTKAEAYTACVLVCRKLLMHIAVEKGAPEDMGFFQYVKYLDENRYIPPDGREWVDYIRQKGNEANHEIVIMEQKDALDLLTFAEMLLKFVYEFPARIPKLAE